MHLLHLTFKRKERVPNSFFCTVPTPTVDAESALVDVWTKTPSEEPRMPQGAGVGSREVFRPQTCFVTTAVAPRSEVWLV